MLSIDSNGFCCAVQVEDRKKIMVLMQKKKEQVSLDQSTPDEDLHKIIIYNQRLLRLYSRIIIGSITVNTKAVNTLKENGMSVTSVRKYSEIS